MPRGLRFAPLLLGVVCGTGCSDDFPNYNELLDFRVLGLRASTPFLAPGEHTDLEALTFEPSGTPVTTWAWSWCPISGGASESYRCAVTQADLQKAVDQVLGAGVTTVPPLELSSTSSAAFAYSVAPQLFRGLCSALKQIPLPPSVPTLTCDDYFPVQIRLEATAGGKTIIAYKELRMLYDASAPKNQNPALTGLSYRPQGAPASEAVPIVAGAPPTLKRDTKYTLSVGIPEADAETYQSTDSATGAPLTKHEVLVTTWFADGGDLDNERTTYIAGEISLDDASRNDFTTPTVAAYPRNMIHLITVIRDGRGGIGWQQHDVQLLGE